MSGTKNHLGRQKKGLAALTKKNQNSTRTATTSGAPAVTLLVFMVIATIALGATSSWRSLPTTTSNPVLQDTPPPMPANAPARDYIYAGSALLSTVEPFRETPNDLGIWRPSTGTFWILKPDGQNVVVQQWGVLGDIPTPGDYDGDGKTDFCVVRPDSNASSTWYIILSSTGANQYDVFGVAADLTDVGDYDGDGKSDVALWRPSNGVWYIHQSSNGGYSTPVLGSSGDKPVAADFDGDGRTDPAIWRDSTATFWVLQSSNNQKTHYTLGQSGDEPVVGDYDGDGRTDFATRRSSDNIWRIRYSSDGIVYDVNWGLSTDIAVQARYTDQLDTDAKTDVAIWRPSTGVWYIRRSSDGSMRAQTFGTQGDIPVPSNWRR